MLIETLSIAITFVIGVLFGNWWISYQRKIGLTSRDIYKGIDGVPRAGGLIAMVSAVSGYMIVLPQSRDVLPLLIIIILTGILGLLDDIKGVSEYVRVFVPFFLALMLARALENKLRLTMPFIGLFYGSTGWLAVLAIPILTNAFNMLDPVNGFLPVANIVIGSTLAIISIIRGQIEAVSLYAVHVAASAALYFYNRYPAKTFNGNVGSYFLGANLSTLAVIYDMVPYLILAALPFVVNGALIIFSSGGIRRREKIQRPTMLVNGIVSQDCSSPIISLVRLIVADRPMTEYDIFKSLVLITSVTSALTLILVVVIKALQLPI